MAGTRLLRSAITYLVKRFGTGTEVGTVFHDASGELERDEYFDWHTIFRMERDHGIVFRPTVSSSSTLITDESVAFAAPATWSSSPT